MVVGVDTSGSCVLEEVRAAEIIATLCLATDLGMGFPFEHGLHTAVVAMRLADELGVDRGVAVDTYYVSLLSHAGCTTDVHVMADVLGGSLTEHLNPVQYGPAGQMVAGVLRAVPDPGALGVTRAFQIARRLPRVLRTVRGSIAAHCEVAGILAVQTGAPASVPKSLDFVAERWDGQSPLRRGAGEEIPLPMRILHVAAEATLQRHLAGVEAAARLVGERAGRGLDPHLAERLHDRADVILGDVPVAAWDEVMSLEPEPCRVLGGNDLDEALAAMGRFADLVSPYRSGHSAGVSVLAEGAAARCGLDPREVRLTGWAGAVHDLGAVAVPAAVWAKPEPLSAHDWEQVRLHPYHTQRVLSPAPALSGLADAAGSHHERLDGSGYHRGSRAVDLSMPARLLAAADAFHTSCEPRPGRGARSPEQAAEELAVEANGGRLDPDAVVAVIEAAGQRPPSVQRPAGLTAREVEVVALLARGMLTKQVASSLGIARKTADRHVQNAYQKMGVSSRAAATLFAMEHGLVTWGEGPIAGS